MSSKNHEVSGSSMSRICSSCCTLCVFHILQEVGAERKYPSKAHPPYAKCIVASIDIKMSSSLEQSMRGLWLGAQLSDPLEFANLHQKANFVQHKYYCYTLA